jgi:hypothetical protein
MPPQCFLGLGTFASKQARDFIHAGSEQDLLEEIDRFSRGLEKAIGLGFQPDVNLLASVIADRR